MKTENIIFDTHTKPDVMSLERRIWLKRLGEF